MTTMEPTDANTNTVANSGPSPPLEAVVGEDEFVERVLILLSALGRSLKKRENLMSKRGMNLRSEKLKKYTNKAKLT